MSRKFESLLVRLRTLRGITQQVLADVLGVTVHTVSNWETGRSVPKLTPRQFKTLLRVLQINAEQLPDDFGPQAGGEVSPLRQLREIAGFSRDELAKELSAQGELVSEGQIQLWEENQQPLQLSIPQIAVLCRMLNVSIHELADHIQSLQPEEPG